MEGVPDRSAATPSRGSWKSRSRLLRQRAGACESAAGRLRSRDRDVRGSVASIHHGEENAPGADKVDGPAEANRGVVKHRIPRTRMGREPRDESGAHVAQVLVERVRRGRSRSDASRVGREGEPQGKPHERR